MVNESNYIVQRMPITNRALRLLAATLVWAAVMLACVGIALLAGIIFSGGILAMFVGAVGIVIYNAPVYLYRTIRNNL